MEEVIYTNDKGIEFRRFRDIWEIRIRCDLSLRDRLRLLFHPSLWALEHELYEPDIAELVLCLDESLDSYWFDTRGKG